MLKSLCTPTVAAITAAGLPAGAARLRRSLQRGIAALALVAAVPLAQAGFITLALPTLNMDIRNLTDGASYTPLFPSTQIWNGTPFDLALDANGNNAHFLLNSALDIPVGIFGVTQAYSLINSVVGSFGVSNGFVEFFGASSYYRVDLVQGVNIRDHFDGIFNNVIDNVNAVAAFNLGPGRARLDEQIYNLPLAFGSDTLNTIRVTGLDLGGGIPFITAATVFVPDPGAVPEPQSYALVLGALGLLAWRRRWA